MSSARVPTHARPEGVGFEPIVGTSGETIGSLAADRNGVSVLDADETYIGTFPDRVAALAALREAWRFRHIRVGVIR